MRERALIPEILDHLPADDPEAIRSRRDLRHINFLMGNERWICRTLARHPESPQLGIVEIGAGDGKLINRLARLYPPSSVEAYDLAPAPVDLDPRVIWHQGDVFEQASPPPGGVIIANLFLHHFEGASLLTLGRWMENSRLLVFSEPDRATLPHRLGGLMHPWINRVTRHDMHASIDAGFTAGELPRLLGLDSARWRFEESSTWRGARRMIGWRT